jgi:hypothetical protein
MCCSNGRARDRQDPVTSIVPAFRDPFSDIAAANDQACLVHKIYWWEAADDGATDTSGTNFEKLVITVESFSSSVGLEGFISIAFSE